MEGRFNVMMLMALVVATMLHGSSAQTTHVVGDSLGWIIPPGGEVAYQTWAAAQTFVIGDVLLFNFTTGSHDVAEVNKASFDSCNTANPTTIINNGPASINLTSAGEHHFICAFPRHCGAGQKLAINVSASSITPTPQPATPPSTVAPQPSTRPPIAVPQPSTRPPVAAPQPSAQPPMLAAAPTPTRPATTYTVGDTLGWIVPSNPSAYEAWTQGKSFTVGDILAFNFANRRHDVLQVTKSEYDSCTVSTTTTLPLINSPAMVPLISSGEHYYICTIPTHCSSGQKLAINVTRSDSTIAPSPNNRSTPLTPTSETVPPPGSNSAASITVVGLPMALFTAVMAFLLN